MSDTPTLRALIERMRKAASYHYDHHISNSTIEDWADELEALLSPAEGRPQAGTLADAAEMLWVVLANVSGGDWTKQSPEWQEAAARWRDNYFAALKADLPAEARVPSERPHEKNEDE